jgi:hypothetical protein
MAGTRVRTPREHPVNSSLADALAQRAAVDTNFWSFGKQLSRRAHGHGIFQYPAMMVPEMVAALLETLRPFLPEHRPPQLLDPFAGSGTVLAEAMPFGFATRGVDINPLAILLCTAKTGPYQMKAAGDALARVLTAVESSRRTKLDVPERVAVWYRPEVAVQLMRLRAAIRTEKDRNVRCVLWCVLAETARQCSNSRTSTFKLHVRSKRDLATRVVDVHHTFRNLAVRALSDLGTHRARLAERGHLVGNYYRYKIDILHSDVRDLATARSRLADVIVTSPPYGDNRSTVPYGQHSWLPAAWVDLADVEAVGAYLDTPYATDTSSLGGRIPRKSGFIGDLAERSPSFDHVVEALTGQPPDRLSRVATFVRDLDASLGPILAGTAAGAPTVWVMGDRRVGGHRIPTTAILRELLESRGARCETTLTRTIATNRKRMALRNSIAATMRHESILVMRAPSGVTTSKPLRPRREERR